jgi:hypothetical protein
MAMNLRPSPEATQAVQRESERTGRSQEEMMREAIAPSEFGTLVSVGSVRRPRAPSRKGF